MDSDEDDVSDSEVLQWYSERVEEIWDSATDSAFNDLGVNLTNIFRQVMNNVKQSSLSNGQAHGSPSTSTSVQLNGGSSTHNAGSPSASSVATNIVLSSDQLMELSQGDEEWLDKDPQSEEEIVVSVQLVDQDQTEENSKNGKGVSRGTKSFSADSYLVLQCLELVLKTTYYSLMLIIISLGVIGSIYLFTLFCNPLQKIFLNNIQNYIYPLMRFIRLWTLPLTQLFPQLSGTSKLPRNLNNQNKLSWWLDVHEETCLVHNPFYWQRPIDCWSCGEISSVYTINNANHFQPQFLAKYYHSGIPLVIQELTSPVTVQDLANLHKSNPCLLVQGVGGFSSTMPEINSLSDFLALHTEITTSNSGDVGQVSWKINHVRAVRLFRRLFPRPRFIPDDTEVGLEKHFFMDQPRTPPYKLVR